MCDGIYSWFDEGRPYSDMRYFLARFIISMLPATRCFRLKRTLLRAIGISVGAGTSICGGVKLYGGGRVTIGSDCWIGLGVKFYSSIGADITIGDRCDIAPEVAFHCGTHSIGPVARRAGKPISAPIFVGTGTWIGIGSTILGGAQLGKASIVGANALVLGKSYPVSALLVGVPAKVFRLLTAGEDGTNTTIENNKDYVGGF